jgi:hypothetical protein
VVQLDAAHVTTAAGEPLFDPLPHNHEILRATTPGGAVSQQIERYSVYTMGVRNPSGGVSHGILLWRVIVTYSPSTWVNVPKTLPSGAAWTDKFDDEFEPEFDRLAQTVQDEPERASAGDVKPVHYLEPPRKLSFASASSAVYACRFPQSVHHFIHPVCGLDRSLSETSPTRCIAPCGCGLRSTAAAQKRKSVTSWNAPGGRVKLGSLLADIGRRIKLTDEDFAVFEQVRDRTPAQPATFE